MSPYTIELPTGDTGISNDLLLPDTSIPPFSDEDLLTDPVPYNEVADINDGIGDSLQMPSEQIKEREPSALERYNARQAAQEEAVRVNELVNRLATEKAQQDYLDRRSVFDLTPLEQAKEISFNLERNRELKEEAYNKDFGWLNGQEHPDWPDFKREFYPDFDNETPEKKDEIFNYWKNNEAKYWVGYRNSDPAKFDDAIIKKWMVDNPEITDNRLNVLQNKLQTLPSNHLVFMRDFGFEPGQPVDRSFYDLNKASLMAARGMKEMTQFSESLKRIGDEMGIEVLNTDGSVNTEAVKNAQAAFQRQESETASEEDSTQDIRDSQSLASDFARVLDGDPNEKFNTLGDTVKTLLEIQGLLALKEPFLKELNEEDGFWKTISKYTIENPVDGPRALTGQVIAQLVDTVPETAAAAVAGSRLGAGPAYVLQSLAGATQEERLVALEGIQEAMSDRGLNIYKQEDWQKALDDKSNFIQEVKEKAAKKGFFTTPVESTLEVIAARFLGGKKFGNIFAKGAAYGTAGVISSAGGEISGQLVSEGKLTPSEIAAEVVGGVGGQAGFTAFEKGVTYGAEKIFGKPNTEATPTAPAPQESKEVPYKEPVKETIEQREQRLNEQSTKSSEPPVESNQSDAEEDGSEVPAHLRNVPGISEQGVARDAKEAAEFIASLPAAKDAAESARVILEANREITDAERAANVFIENERTLQSLQGLRSLNDSLRREEFYSNLTQPPIVRLEVPATPAERAASFIESQLVSDERLRQSSVGRQALANDLSLYNTEEQPFTQEELNQMEFLGVLSPEEKNQYLEYAKTKAVNQSRRALNTVIASNLLNRAQQEERIRQSPQGLEALNRHYTELQNQVNEQADIVDKLIELAGSQEQRPTREPLQDIQFPQPVPETLSSSFRQENESLPDKAKARWTPEIYAQADEYFRTGNEAVLQDMTEVQRNRIIRHREGTIEEAEAAARGMSVDKLYKARRVNQGGYFNLPAVTEEIARGAIAAWGKAKDFASWSADMTSRFGNSVKDILTDLWNNLTSLIKQAFPYKAGPTVNNAEVTITASTPDGPVDITMNSKDAESMLTKRINVLQSLLDCLGK